MRTSMFSAVVLAFGVAAVVLASAQTEPAKPLPEAPSAMQESAGAHTEHGIDLAKQGRYDEAIVEFHRAIAINPDYVEAHYNLGLVLFNEGDLDGAVGEYRKALSLKPDLAEAHNNLGNALTEKGSTTKPSSSSERPLCSNLRSLRLTPTLGLR
jgi:Flp pilus assembly protein TadD